MSTLAHAARLEEGREGGEGRGVDSDDGGGRRGGEGVKVRRLGVRFVNGRLRRNTNDQTRDWVIQGEGATGRGEGRGCTLSP